MMKSDTQSSNIVDDENHDNSSTDASNSDGTIGHCDDSSTQRPRNTKRLFFTTTDLLDKINSSLSSTLQTERANDQTHPNVDDDDNGVPRFELQRRFPDGTTRKATPEEAAAADFQAKLKQAAQIVGQLSSSEEKLYWAQKQREAGNELFVQQKYQEAMDVYLTCLVAMEDIQNCKGTENHDNHENHQVVKHDHWKEQTEEQIQLPVLLNLSACTLKLAMYKKTKIFCDLALDLQCGKRSPKAYFRRAKAQMFLGSYQDAKSDLVHCLDLIKNATDKYSENIGGASSMEAATVERELIKVESLMQKAELNRKRQKQAMQHVFSGTSLSRRKRVDVSEENDDPMDDGLESIGDENEPTKKELSTGRTESLYEHLEKKPREYSTLRAPWYYKHVLEGETTSLRQQRHVSTKVWYLFHVRRLAFMLAEQYLFRFLSWIKRKK